MDYLALYLYQQLTVVAPQIDAQIDFARDGEQQEQVQLLTEQTRNSGEAVAAELSHVEQFQVAQAPTIEKSDNRVDDQPFVHWLQTIKQSVVNGGEAILSQLGRAWQAIVTEKYPGQGASDYELQVTVEDIGKPGQSGEALHRHKQPVISPDAALLHLAAVEIMDKEPQFDPESFQPEVGPRFNEDGSVTLRVLVGNTSDRLTLVGDFNNWGSVANLEDYQLQPTAENPLIHELTLPPGDYHLAQYRLRDQYGRDRLDLSADLYATPAFNKRFYGTRRDDALNAVLWEPTPIPPEEQAERPDLRGKQLVIAEADMVSLSLQWVCRNPDSSFYGQTGADNISRLYRFVGECGIPEKLAELGYSAVEFMPLDTHVDFWDPDGSYFPDWRYSYQTINYYGKHADFGSPDELRFMNNAFHEANVAVLLDVVYSHFSNEGNNHPRQFGGVGFSQYKREDGGELYGGSWTEWGTRRFSYTPEVRKNIIDAALKNILDYGFDGLRIDNVNGIDAQPYGRTLLREMAEAFMLYYPQAVIIGEGYFGDPYLNRALEVGGAGLTTTYSDRFYLWFTEDLLKHRWEVDTRRLDYMLNNDWTRVLLYYPGNHDEFANPGNPFQARGRYLVEAIDGGDFHNRKIQSWSALTLFASSYYLDMPQLWTMQPGNLNYNAAVDWPRLRNESVTQVANFQSDMKQFFTTEEAFAPYNVHRHMVHWVDHDNKVIVFERIDFTTGRRAYVAVNLGDEAIADYRISVHPEDATFRLALDSDRRDYGGQKRNSDFQKADNHELAFYLGSYGVVGLVQQNKLTPPPVDEGEIVMPDYDRSACYLDYGYCPYAE